MDMVRTHKMAGLRPKKSEQLLLAFTLLFDWVDPQYWVDMVRPLRWIGTNHPPPKYPGTQSESSENLKLHRNLDC